MLSKKFKLGLLHLSAHKKLIQLNKPTQNEQVKVNSAEKIKDVHNGSDEKEILFCNNDGEIGVDCDKEELKLDYSEIKVESDKVVIQVDTFEEEVKIDNNEWDIKVESL